MQFLAGTAVHVHIALEAEGGPVDGAVEVGCTSSKTEPLETSMTREIRCNTQLRGKDPQARPLRFPNHDLQLFHKKGHPLYTGNKRSVH